MIQLSRREAVSYTHLDVYKRQIGNSLLEEDKQSLALEILEKAKAQNVKVYLPVDTVIADEFNNDADRRAVSYTHLDVYKRQVP